MMNPVRNGSAQSNVPFARQTQSSGASGSSSDYNRLKMSAFRALKPTCVQLMGLATQRPTSSTPHTRLIVDLTRIVTTLPPASLNPSMINYILFPITQILRQNDPKALPDVLLEAVFKLLTMVVGAWKRCDGGMDYTAWEQLWRIVVATIGPQLGKESVSSVNGKGKGRASSQELQLEAVHLLSALLEPIPELSHPSASMKDKLATSKSPMMPTLFQTITLLLELIHPIPANLQLQLSSLQLLRSLLKTYLKGQHNVLAAVLPGTTSAIAKLVHTGGKAIKGEVAAESLGLVEDIVTLTLNDENLEHLGVLRPKLDDLSQLYDEWDTGQSNAGTSKSPTPSDNAGREPFPPISASYLSFTSERLYSAVVPIFNSLTSHQSHLARQACASLAASLLSNCHGSLPQLTQPSLVTLLLLSHDDFDTVKDEAQLALRASLGHSDLQLDATLLDLLSEAINTLPRSIISSLDAKVDRTAKLITAIAEITSSNNTKNPIGDLLGRSGHVERWSWSLLNCLEFGRPVGWSAQQNTASRAAQKGWEQQRFLTSSIPLLIAGTGENDTGPSFPPLPLRYVESEATYRALEDMLVKLGSSGGELALHSVDFFVSFARANRRGQVAKAVSALWVAQCLLDGIARSEEASAEGKVSRKTRKMAREMTRVVISIDEDEDDAEDEDPVVSTAEDPETSDALLPIERKEGLDTITTLLDRPIKGNTFSAQETRRLHIQAQRSLLSALSMSSLALSSEILSTSFRPSLLNALYPLLAHLASPQSIVQSFAEIALAQVAHNCGYAGVQNLVLDNVDYVINVVSQRLTHARLSSTAPLVLIAMIKLVGADIVPMVHDIVDEVFDALDDYHGYEVLASGLLAVLVTVIDVMTVEAEAEGLSEARVKKLAELSRLDEPPNPETDFAKFKVWYEARAKQRQDTIDSILERAPQHAWGKDKAQDDQQEGEEEPDGDTKMDDSDPPPTRAQEVCTLILSKSLNFLTHRSPLLRARILSLISKSTTVLALGNREGDLLPLIDQHWKIILNRLDDVPYVVTEAAEVIAGLCEHCGDFISRRILDHAWPKFKQMLEKQQEQDKKSALARRGAVGTESEWTVSHRLHIAILRTAEYMVQQVPMSDQVLWEMMVLFRQFIDKRAHQDLQDNAMDVYRHLVKRDGDALWVMLNATLGKEGGLWKFLREPDLDISSNAKWLM